MFCLFFVLILEMVGRRRNQTTRIVSGSNNQERRQRRRIRRGRIIRSNNSNYDYEIIRNDVPSSIQNILWDQRAWMREGRKKYEEFKQIQMNPSSSIPEYILLFNKKREELTSHFIWVLDPEALFIFIFSLPDHWMKLMISFYNCLGPNKDYLTCMYALKIMWEQKIDMEAKIKKSWLLKSSSRPRFYQSSPIDNLSKILADSIVNPYHQRNVKDIM